MDFNHVLLWEASLLWQPIMVLLHPGLGVRKNYEKFWVICAEGGTLTSQNFTWFFNLYKPFLPEGCESQMGHCWLCICRKLTTEKSELSYDKLPLSFWGFIGMRYALLKKGSDPRWKFHLKY